MTTTALFCIITTFPTGSPNLWNGRSIGLFYSKKSRREDSTWLSKGYIQRYSRYFDAMYMNDRKYAKAKIQWKYDCYLN